MMKLLMKLTGFFILNHLFAQVSFAISNTWLTRGYHYRYGGNMFRDTNSLLVNYRNVEMLANQDRVVNGLPTSIHKYPFMVSIFSQILFVPKFAGGGTIVSSHWVVTAAHVAEIINSGILRKEIVVRSNSTYLSRQYIQHTTEYIHIHEEYNSTTHLYDIALIRVKEPFLGNYARPVPMADKNYKFVVGSPAAVIGWGVGDYAEIGFGNDYLRVIVVELMNYEKCKQHLSYYDVTVDHEILCTLAPGKSACFGDSGGPLYQNGILIGIASRVVSNCRQNEPNIFINVSTLYPWIKRYTGGDGNGYL